ncbi:MAG: hypothetical protein GPJ54_11835 [Candidatus Heimdallarchaeota archaeon]|nr:hypothetical protein [Candidatus Heimdallarchaeota archaeon]
MDLQDIKDRLINSANLSKNHINDLVTKTKEVGERAKSWRKRDSEGKEREINDFLFTADELPTFGKEYWFFLLTGNENSHKDQLMVSFGRNRGHSMQIDDSMQFQDGDNYHGGIGEIWFYDNGKTTKFGKLGGKIITSEHSVSFTTDEYEAIFSRAYPEFNLSVTKGGTKIVDIQTTMPKIGDSMEFFTIDKMNFGVEVGNVYLDYTGKLSGGEFVGRAYMQKVVMSAPFIPWYWGRFIFENGSVMVFFLLWVELPGISKTIYSQGKFYDVEAQTYHKFDDFEIKRTKNTDYWTLTHDSEEKNVYVLMESYTNNVFVMKSRGEFNYDEMFVEIKEIRIKIGDRIYDENEFGKGSGSLEAATGFAF